MNLRREVLAAGRHVGIGLGLTVLMLAVFWMIFWMLS